MFESLFDIAKKAFIHEPLLPRYKGGYVSANESLIARTKELRELFTPEQLSYLFKGKYCWLHDEISQDRTPDLRKYFMNELDITEVQSDTIINKIDSTFLQKQENKWIREFYEFLNKQKSIHEKLKSLPIIRLSTMEHIAPYKNGQRQVWLPGQKTDFPTVHEEVCGSKDSESMAFLKAIGLTEPNPVDDVIWNILPKFDEISAGFTEEAYKQAIQRILVAFDTDSARQKENLLSALKNKKFVAVINAATGEKSYAEPGSVYFQTESFKSLFDGIDSIHFVNEAWGLKGDKVRELLEKCGVYRNLRPVEQRNAFSHSELAEMRIRAGYGDCTSDDTKNDNTLYGLEELLDYIQCSSKEDKISRTNLIWKELSNLYERRGSSVFSGTYSWSYSWSSHHASFDAYFIRILNKSAWVPDNNGNLRPPRDIIFNSLNWEDNPFLRSKIHFKSDEIQEFEEKTGYKVISQNEYEQFRKWQEAQIISPLDTDEKPKKEFTPVFSVADVPLRVNDFTGKDQSVSFDNSQLNKSAVQNPNNDSLPDSENSLSNQDAFLKNDDSLKESDINMEYRKEEGRYGEDYVLRLLNEEYKGNTNIEIINLNVAGKPGVGADFVVKYKTSEEIIKLVEVKSTTDLKGSKQRISGNQWETARYYFKINNGDLYWIYCVYNIKTNPEVLRLQNPIQKWQDGLLFADPVDFIIKE
jgi:hypothetical protein